MLVECLRATTNVRDSIATSVWNSAQNIHLPFYYHRFTFHPVVFLNNTLLNHDRVNIESHFAYIYNQLYNYVDDKDALMEVKQYINLLSTTRKHMMDETKCSTSESDVSENTSPINRAPINNSSNILYELMATPIKKTKQHTYESLPRVDEECGNEDVVQTHDNFSSTFNSKSTDSSFTSTSTFSVKGADQFTWEKHLTGVGIMVKIWVKRKTEFLSLGNMQRHFACSRSFT